jgi:hypothetical protein
MGHKRKASAIATDDLPFPSSPPSLTSTSTSSSPSSMCTEPYHTRLLEPVGFAFNLKTTKTPNTGIESRYRSQLGNRDWLRDSQASNWLSRTRKRVRNRPNEEMVYQETVRKLWEGQQHLNDTSSSTHDGDFQLQLGLDGAMDDDEVDMEDGGVRIEDVPTISITGAEAEVGQRSLHDFFGGQHLHLETQEEKERPRTAPVQAGWSFGQLDAGDAMEFETTTIPQAEQSQVERGQQTMDWFLFGRR